MEVNLIGDSRATLQALLPLLQPKSDRSWRDEIEGNVEKWWRVLEARAMNDANPINPQRVFWELSRQLPDNCILTCDTGTSAAWFARDIKIRRGMKASLSGGLATMGPAVPYAIAAKFAHPTRPVIALLGDGAMQMNGINGLVTIAHQWKKWGNGCMVLMVLNNSDLNMVTWEERVEAGDPKFNDSQVLPPFPYAEYAKLIGLHGIRVDRPERISAAWEEAIHAGRPTVLEMVTDPNVPPLPPHVSAKQAKNYAKALLRRDPEAIGVVIASAKEVWDGLFPRKSRER